MLKAAAQVGHAATDLSELRTTAATGLAAAVTAELSGLAMAEADDLQRQVGRLQRRLTGTAMAPISLATVRAWILRARASASRPGN